MSEATQEPNDQLESPPKQLDAPPKQQQARPPKQQQQQQTRNRPPRGDGKVGGGEKRPERREGGGRQGGGGGDRRPEPFADIDYDKLVSDPLYLDNQAHVVVSRMRDMDTGTRSQLRRLFNAIRRAVRSPESERQHEFVMLRARLAYTIARHSLRSLDVLEKLLLQVTRKNELRGYERFRDLFEAIIAYNE